MEEIEEIENAEGESKNVDLTKDRSVRRYSAALVTCLVVATTLVHVTSYVVKHRHPTLSSNMTLAFVLGLRHAVDCDHLAAIDNVTRQLLRHGQRPVSVGCWFAVGHSTIVWIMCVALSLGYKWVSDGMNGSLATKASMWATMFSAALILAVGLMNAQVTFELLKTWKQLRRESKQAQAEALETKGQDDFQSALSSIPCLRKVFSMVNRPEKMYFVGFLFGLGFDTATQVGLLGLAAMTGTSEALPFWMVTLIPMAFSCGMCLVDTVNGLLMLATYSWADVDPMQKLMYNLTVTSLSSIIAITIFALEILQMIADQTSARGPFWDSIRSVNMANIGYAMIGCFLMIFLGSMAATLCQKRSTAPAEDLEPLLRLS